VTPRQTRFAHVLEWIADAGPEDLADLRREIEAETQEFLLAEEEHRIHLAGLRRLESILAERCGEVVAAPEPPISITQPVHEPVAAIEAEPNPAEAPSQTALDTFLGKVARWESTVPITTSEDSVDEREPPPDDDDSRSVEERLRDSLRKLGERSSRQLGGILGVEKSVVLSTLESSQWFRRVKGAEYEQMPEVNRPWKLSKLGASS